MNEPLPPEAARPSYTFAGFPIRRIFCQKPKSSKLEIPRKNGHHIDRRPEPNMFKGCYE